MSTFRKISSHLMLSVTLNVFKTLLQFEKRRALKLSEKLRNNDFDIGWPGYVRSPEMMLFLLGLYVSSLPVHRPHHHHHSLKRRSHPPPKPPLLSDDDEEVSILKNLDAQEARSELSHHGIRKLIVKDDDADRVVEEDILEEGYDDSFPEFHFDEEEAEKESKTFKEEFPKKFTPNSNKKRLHFKDKHHNHHPFPEVVFEDEKDEDKSVETTTKESVKVSEGRTHHVTAHPVTTNPTTMPSHPSTKRISSEGHYDPLVLPVTTEGKTNTKQKLEEPLKVYGFPKELLPIMPGGGSRFDDVEREKLEKKKMSQTKGGDDDSAESGGSHEAEGLYSSASLSSISIVFYCLVSFLFLDRISL